MTVREVNVVHPAAKPLVMVSRIHEVETGQATHLVINLAGELLKGARAGSSIAAIGRRHREGFQA
ncbi:hypothetical protein BJ912DRAFT_1061938 [Pholiota molesta]|nr:hypothetical protein BJ912DRAFT_1061938 [Pholiota molesta]